MLAPLGVIAAVLGAENQSGDFEVADMCFAGMAHQPISANSSNGSTAEKESAEGDDPCVALLSGLDFGSNEDPSDYRVGLLAEWLTGEAGSEEVKIHDLASP